MFKIILICFVMTPGLWAGEAVVESDQAADYGSEDTLYAPEDMSPSAQVVEGSRGSFYSSAHITACDVAQPGSSLEGAEIFIDGNYMGKSPLNLEGFLVNKAQSSLTARLSGGWHEASRPALSMPAEGELKIYLAGEASTHWYSRPAFGIGLALLAGSVLAYSQNKASTSSLGLGLVIGGSTVIAVSQIIARYIHLPALLKRAEALNAQPEPEPKL